MRFDLLTYLSKPPLESYQQEGTFTEIIAFVD